MVAIAFSLTTFAQTTPPTKDTVPTQEKKIVYVMKDSKMWVVTNGEKTEMLEDATLKNGTTVKSDGTVKGPQGEVVKLKESQYIDQNGTIGDWKEAPDEKETPRE